MIVRFGLMASAALLLCSCATVIEKPTQDLKIDVVGTGEVLCDVTQPGLRYRAYAPSTIKVRKSRNDLNVRCFAPGNREQTVVLKSTQSDMVMANVSNGILPGLAWDATSGAMYKYPESVLMDFTHTPPQPYPLPDYQLVLNSNPSLIGMEEFTPGQAALVSDMGTGTKAMQRSSDDMGGEGMNVITASPITTPVISSVKTSTPATYSATSADALTREANPGIFKTRP